jgi:hypothetical protein
MSAWKFTLLGIAALLLATGTAHSIEDNPVLMILACHGTVSSRASLNDKPESELWE